MNKHICLKCKKPLEKKEYQRCHGLHEACFCHLFHLGHWMDFQNVILKNGAWGSSYPKTVKSLDKQTQSQKHRSFNSSFFQGQFKKYTAELKNKNFILKIKEEQAPELPDVEYVCNQIAQTLKINIPWFALIDFYGIRTFITENFITNSKEALSLNHIYHYLDENSLYSCKELLEIIKNQTHEFVYQESFVHMCLFDALIGNHDRHGRNIGFLTSPNKKILAPIYDNPSFLGLQSGSILQAQFNPCGKIRTEKSAEPTMVDYVDEFFTLGLGTSVTSFFHSIPPKTIINLIQDSFCSLAIKKAFERLFSRRYQELKDALSHRSV